jgi:long-chain acyl-CoA synthetase
MNLAQAFIRSAQNNSSKPALFYGDAEYSFADALSKSQAIAARLRDEFGVRPGDRVGLWLKNCPEFVFSLFGTLLAEAVVVPINNFLKPDEVSYIAADAGISVLISDSEMSEGLSALIAKRPELRIVKADQLNLELEKPAKEFPVSDLLSSKSLTGTESDLAVIIYTSGTTGKPKGAMLSHVNLLSNVESCRQVLQISGLDRFAVILPLFHSFMLTVGTLLPLLVGGSILLVRSLHPMKNMLQEIIDRKATVMAGIPQFFRALVAAPITAKDLPIRLFISGAAPLPVPTLEEFAKKFGVPLIEGYGLSEASPVCSTNPPQGPIKIGSIGPAIPDVEMSIQNDEGTILGPRETGEVCIRGGNVMQGYWNQPEETAKSLRNGWLLTGDIGHRDEDNYFYITDRKKDMLLVNGINVYPRELEEIIYQFPGIKEAAVIGVPDKRKGEQPMAFVAAADGMQLDEKQIQEFVRGKLADYKVPRRIVVMTKLPRNATGKILKTELRKIALAEKETSTRET